MINDEKNIFHENGIFWLGNEKNKEKKHVAGALKLEKSGVSYLDLVGVLINETEAVFDQNKLLNDVVIYGVLAGGKGWVVLNRISRNGGTMVLDGVSVERFFAFDCLLFSNQGDINHSLKFNNLTVDLTKFSEWFGCRGIRVAPTRSQCNIVVKMPKLKKYNINQDLITVSHRVLSGLNFYNEVSSINVKQISLLSWKSKKVLSLESQRENFKHIEDLLFLLTGNFAQIPWPTLKNSKGKVCTYYFARDYVADRHISLFDCLTSWNRLKDDFGKIFFNLLNVREKWGPGLYLYLSARQGKNLSLENKFMSLIWGLESLHRRSQVLEIPVENGLQEKIERILNKIENKGDRRWLNRKLKNAGEPSLGERLNSLFMEIPIEFDPNGLRSFADECASLRNNISHFGGLRNEGDSYHEFSNRIYSITEILVDMYHILLLHRIGLDSNLILFHVYQSPKSYQYRKIFQKFNLSPKLNMQLSNTGVTHPPD